MSCPLNWIEPDVGTRNLVSRLKQVVLPAPLGPINALNGAPADSQVHVADSSEAFELFGQALCFKDHVTHWAWFTPWCGKKIRLH